MTTLGVSDVLGASAKNRRWRTMVVVAVVVFATMVVVVCALAGLHLDRFKDPAAR